MDHARSRYPFRVLLSKVIAMLVLLATAGPALAYTECTGRPVRIFLEGDGVYGWLDTGAHWYVSPSTTATDVKSILALTTSALVADGTITVRFMADGVSCSSPTLRNDVWGIFLNGQ